MIELSQFIGPMGGLLCIAWAMGAIAGYAFYSKTVHKMYKKLAEAKQEFNEGRIKELEDECHQLRTRVAVLEARYDAHGEGRIKFLDKGEVRDVGPRDLFE